MSSELLATPRPSQDVDPFHIGTRYLKCIDANGKPDVTLVPLSEEDFLHPQEEDRFMLTNAHSVAVWYLRQSILQACRTRPSIRVFSDHCIDWQHPDIAPHGPDVVVFDRFTVEWDELRGTLPVADLGIEVVAVFEVTSESTRHIDFDKKSSNMLRSASRITSWSMSRSRTATRTCAATASMAFVTNRCDATRNSASWYRA